MKPTEQKRYFVIKKANCGPNIKLLQNGTCITSDIIGITDDEEYAKSLQSVFCCYEEVEMIDAHDKKY